MTSARLSGRDWVARLRLGVVSTYPPVRDARAAYARELIQELGRDMEIVVCAVDRYRCSYPDEVVAVISENEIGDYRRAADILADHAVDAALVCDQGWPGTHHLLDELRRSAIPCLVALPAIRREAPADHEHPDPYRAVAALAGRADRLLVRTDAAARAIAAAAGDRVRVIPGGVPIAVPHALPALVRELDRGGQRIIATVGRIRPGSGIETAIAALGQLVTARPDLRYVVAGAVESGTDEPTPDGAAVAYRYLLHQLVAKFDLGSHVTFIDTRLTPAEATLVLDRALVHVVPRLDPERTCSATLARGLAAGRPTVAGLHPYAAELLANGSGLLVRPGDPGALAARLAQLLDDPDALNAAGRAARSVGAGFGARAVAPRLAGLVREVARPRLERASVPPLSLPPVPSAELDPARAAVVAAGLLGLPVELLPPSAWSTAVGWAGAAVPRLVAMASEPGPAAAPDAAAAPVDGEPAPGHALWGLGRVAGSRGVPASLAERAAAVRDEYATVPADLTETAFAVLGLAPDPTPGGRLALRCAAGRLNAAWRDDARGWPWFTQRFAPEGARLPQALIAASVCLADHGMLTRGLESLDWYARRIGLTADGPRGTVAGADPAIETGAVVEAYAEAFRATGSIHYGRTAVRCLTWFGSRTDSLPYLGAVLALHAAELAELCPAAPARGDLEPAA